jgi:hypothetical protein
MTGGLKRSSVPLLWCGGSHPYKEFPEKDKKENSVPKCYKCSLNEGVPSPPSNYRGCIHGKEESLRRRTQRSNKGYSRKVVFLVIPVQSFAAVLLRGHQQL